MTKTTKNIIFKSKVVLIQEWSQLCQDVMRCTLVEKQSSAQGLRGPPGGLSITCSEVTMAILVFHVVLVLDTVLTL